MACIDLKEDLNVEECQEECMEQRLGLQASNL